MDEVENLVKCIAVGDGFVGKTSLLTRLANKDFDPACYTPTVFDNSSVEIVHNNQKFDLHLLDTAGQESYHYLRTQAYSNVNIFLVCFSVTNMDSFTNINEVWIPEIQKCSPNPSLILIGTKSDLRNDPETIDRMNISQEYFVSFEVAQNFAQSINVKYIECSARTKENIQEVINTIIDVYLGRTSSSLSINQCCINPIINLLRRVICCKHF